LRSQVSDRHWDRIARKAMQQETILRSVLGRCGETGHSSYEALSQVSPETSWSTLQYWLQRIAGLEPVGWSWEDLVDRRIPPKRKEIPPEVRVLAVALRRDC